MGGDSELLALAVEAAVAAGRLTLEYYQTHLEVDEKEDRSPLTAADRAAHCEIVTRLREGSGGIPIISEEGDHGDYRTRSGWSELWLVDPLDGTKEFLRRTGDFTVNIALVRSEQPALGVVYVPADDILYTGVVGDGAEMVVDAGSASGAGQRLALPSRPGTEGAVTVTASRSHNTPPTDRFIELVRAEYGVVEVLRVGSAVKICRVAEGAADFYPRFGPTMEWDTAAGDAVLRAAGGTMLSATDGGPLRYNKADLHNPDFVCVAPGRELPTGTWAAG